MTENLSEKLEQLSAAATQGEWVVSTCSFDNYAFTISAPASDGRYSHTIADVCQRGPAKDSAAFIVALVAAYRTGQLVAVQADDATVDRVARAVHDAMVEDEESDAWMSGKCPLDSVTIDGDVNLIKAAKAAISALAAKGDA